MQPIPPEVSAAARSIGWYVHLPFCRTKCGYCDFYSLPTIPGLIDGLILALHLELSAQDPALPVETVFIGGGTPTELPATALRTLLEPIRARTGNVREYSVEANPSSADELKLELLLRCGANRISFGAQSFDRRDLTVLERIHDPDRIPESVHAARAAGFENVNLDLIYAIPGQTLTRWRDTLRRAIDLGTEHLSCYALMYEPATSLTRLRDQGRIRPCDEGLEIDMFELTIDELRNAGFEHYEISNFARPGRQCLANLIYWENREYLGIGPSAVSFLDGARRKNVADVRKYVELLPTNPEAVVVEQERLSPRAHACETAVQMLRLTRGIDVESFAARTGYDPNALFAEPIRRFSAIGLMETAEGAIRLTRRGLLVANRIMEEFLLDQSCDGSPPGRTEQAAAQ